MMDGINFGALLAQKYDLMQQGQDTARRGMTADANLTNVRAGLLPKETAANIGLVNAQTTLAGANARQADETTKTIVPLAGASIYNSRQQGGLYGAQAVGETMATRLAPAAFKFRGMGATTSGLDERIQKILGGGGM